MRVGLFFGSFNPIHHGHLIVGSYILQQKMVDQVWYIVSPLNPFKLTESLQNEYQRLHLVRLAIDGMRDFRASDIEFKMHRPSYTADTMRLLAEMHPTHEFEIILGSDSYMNVTKWKEGQDLIERNSFIVYERKGFTPTIYDQGRCRLLNAPLIEISSTMIRKMIRDGESIKYYVPDSVMEEIVKGSYYKVSVK